MNSVKIVLFLLKAVYTKGKNLLPSLGSKLFPDSVLQPFRRRGTRVPESKKGVAKLFPVWKKAAKSPNVSIHLRLWNNLHYANFYCQ